jgi:hypothetical protein
MNEETMQSCSFPHILAIEDRDCVSRDYWNVFIRASLSFLGRKKKWHEIDIFAELLHSKTTMKFSIYEHLIQRTSYGDNDVGSNRYFMGGT